MALSWNEIRTRAIQFAKEWEQDTSEEAEAKSFWDQFFTVFGITRRRVATFEHKVPLPGHHTGYIDVLWKGVIMVEHKSRGRNLDRALTQAKDYFPGLAEEDLPRYILISDFARFRLYDLEAGEEHEFTLQELPQRIHLFDFLLGFQKRHYAEQDPINVDAALRMGQLHDQLKAAGYEGHELELYLVRLLFCLFADDTGIFNKEIFLDLVERKTRPDGSDIGLWLHQLFEVLDRPEDKRLRTLDEDLQAFPYVNGKLFAERLPLASFDSGMRSSLLHCCGLDWGQISPAIFGSLFQSVMNPKERRSLGAHYTSEKNIMKLIKPLFLDALWQEFEGVRHNRNRLLQFHRKLASLRFLDPACGCGNFLIITYRELRLLEIEVLKELQKGQQVLDITQLVRVDVDQFFGIEYEEFPSQIAQVAMWLMDHQMNMRVSQEFGEYLVRLPLRKSATIVHGNALRVEWQSLLPAAADGAAVVYDYILGNPPFIGKSLQNESQKVDLEIVFSGMQGTGVMDYVAAWYLLAAKYIQGKPTKVAFVSTNSVAQGEQVSVLWSELFNKYRIKIHFAHRTFSWSNEAKGNAAVHVVIIGFANYDTSEKLLYEYDNIKGEPHELKVSNINPYLVGSKDLVIPSRTTPICAVPKMIYGSKPVDDGNFFLTDEEKELFLRDEPLAEKYVRPILSSHEFLNGKNRWCLWLQDVSPADISKMPLIRERLRKIREFREKSAKASVRAQAAIPTLFSEIRQPKTNYIVIPIHTSENRKYVPFGFFEPSTILSNSCSALPNASLFHFGVLSSVMHMVWIKYTCGRIKSDFRYSNILVYNNFPWPESPSEKQVKAVEAAAQEVLDARAAFPGSSLADLYDPLTMPPHLVKAHQHLDRAVDLCYRPQPFTSETKRMEYLFELYDRYTAGLFVKEKKVKVKKAKGATKVEIT